MARRTDEEFRCVNNIKSARSKKLGVFLFKIGFVKRVNISTFRFNAYLVCPFCVIIAKTPLNAEKIYFFFGLDMAHRWWYNGESGQVLPFYLKESED